MARSNKTTRLLAISAVILFTLSPPFSIFCPALAGDGASDHTARKQTPLDFETEEEKKNTEKEKELFMQGNYELLTANLDRIQKEYEEGRLDDIGLVHSYRAFYSTDPSLEEKYNDWVEKYPKSYTAHQARAVYYDRMSARVVDDGKMPDQMSDEEKQDMQHYQSLAFEDNKAAILLTGKPFAAYAEIIELCWIGKCHDLAKTSLDQANKMDPMNFIARIRYMQTLETLWGGNTEEMRKFREDIGKSELPKEYLRHFDEIMSFEMNWLATNANQSHTEMLVTNNFDQLDNEMNNIQREYEEGKWDDQALAARFKVFYGQEPAFEPQYNAWVKSYPRSYAAHQARGEFYLNLGLIARGGAYISKTSQNDLNSMQRYFAMAADDYKAALTLTEKPIMTYSDLLTISMEHGSKSASKEIFDSAEKIDPNNFLLRARYIETLQPKWGGSFQEMKKYRDDMYRSGASVDLLRELDGKIFVAIGDVCDNCDGASHDYANAAKWYKKAADLGAEEGQYKFGELYAKGEGVPQNLEEAYYWLQLSTSHGNQDYIAARDQMEAQLAPERVEDIKRRAREWRAAYIPEKPN